jgi:hypothetical protein
MLVSGDIVIISVAFTTFLVILTVGICITIMQKRDPSIIREIISSGALSVVTVLVLVMAIVTLGVMKILPPELIGSILSGMAGYVLGTARSRPNASPAPAGRSHDQAEGQ